MKQLLIFCIESYQRFISPILVVFFGHACRYTPTCSEYFIQATRQYGAKKGLRLGLQRLSRCHPFVRNYKFVDPVPTKV